MKNLKFILSYFTIFFIATSSCISANAQNSSYISGDSTTQQTVDEIRKETELSDRRKRVDMLFSKFSDKLRLGTDVKLIINVYEQETNYWCGPASVQMAAQNITGVKYSQSSLATKMGTTSAGTNVSKVVETLNFYAGLGTYKAISTSTLSAFFNDVKYTIDADLPLIFNPHIKNLIGYEGYSGGGHYVVGGGYSFTTLNNPSSYYVYYIDPFSTINEVVSLGSHKVAASWMLDRINENNSLYIAKN